MTPQAAESVALGFPIPPLTPHAISVSLPTWRDNVDFKRGEKRVIDALVSGYPRFFICPCVQKLFIACEQKFAMVGEKCMLFPSKSTADHYQAFILDRAALTGVPATVRLLQYTIHPEDTAIHTCKGAELYIALSSVDTYPLSFEFWKHTGLGISTRFAEHCLTLLLSRLGGAQRPGALGTNRPSGAMILLDPMSNDQSKCHEERNSPLSAGTSAKRVLRRRILELVTGNVLDARHELCPVSDTQDSTRDAQAVNEDDVYLFPTGMAAIWNAHQLCLRARPPAKTVCFGFPFIATLKVFKKWGPGVHFFGHGLDSDMDALENLLAEEFNRDPTKPPILALFTESTSNPLLRSPDIPRLRSLADTYDFVLVIDDTIGNFVNVDVLQYADIVVTSLTKIFSGAANVMGGSLVLNPKRRHYAALTGYMDTYEDTYFDEDAVVMERNSRDMARRVRIIDKNTEAVCEFLHSRTIAENAPSAVIKELAYPKYTTPSAYLQCKRPNGGYGGMFSLTFTSLAASTAFFDALSCHKGPGLGTNFTLACPYSVFAFPTELEWAAQYGVEEASVRICVGMEDRDWLLHCMDTALQAAESAQ